MFASLSKDAQDNAQFGSRVRAISREKGTTKVWINDKEPAREYSAVVSTIPSSCLSFMDLTGVDIHDDYTQWGAFRGLQYGPAIKIGLEFNEPWWETLPMRSIRSGQSHTDLPLRTM